MFRRSEVSKWFKVLSVSKTLIKGSFVMCFFESEFSGLFVKTVNKIKIKNWSELALIHRLEPGVFEGSWSSISSEDLYKWMLGVLLAKMIARSQRCQTFGVIWCRSGQSLLDLYDHFRGYNWLLHKRVGVDSLRSSKDQSKLHSATQKINMLL